MDIVIWTAVLGLVLGYGWITWRLWMRRHHLRSFQSFLGAIEGSFYWRPLALPTIPSSLDRATFYIESLELLNIRCFSQFTVEFTGDSAVSPIALIVGDNATGKSTLLRALALGLCPESEAIGLMKRLPGTLLRHGTKEGSVSVMLRAGDNHARITTSIKNVNGQEQVRQTTSPSDFSWDDLFICAYGTQRITEATSSYEGYERQHAVETLFSDSAKLMNPEVVMLRRDQESRKALEHILLKILMREDWRIQDSKRGLLLDGPTGTQPLATLSDGYRSTTQWVLDYLGWQILAGRFSVRGTAGGILLIDEIEQHLHPRWQRHILHLIREQFPNTQLIVTTHTPLVAAGAADLASAQILSLGIDAEDRIQIEDIPRSALRGRRADQILAEVFGLWTSKSPGSEEDIDLYSALLSKSNRTVKEERELMRLRQQLQEAQTDQTHQFSQQVEAAVSKVLDEMAKNATERLDFEPEVRRQLENLLKETEAVRKTHQTGKETQ